MLNEADVPEQRPRLRVALSIAAGMLAEVLTIVVVGVVILQHRLLARGQSDQALRDFAVRAATIIGPLGGAIFTFLMAYWVVRKARGRFMEHALLVAAGAIALHTLSTIGAPGGYRAIYLFADLLKVVAGGAAGWVAGRGRTAGSA